MFQTINSRRKIKPNITRFSYSDDKWKNGFEAILLFSFEIR